MARKRKGGLVKGQAKPLTRGQKAALARMTPKQVKRLQFALAENGPKSSLGMLRKSGARPIDGNAVKIIRR